MTPLLAMEVRTTAGASPVGHKALCSAPVPMKTTPMLQHARSADDVATSLDRATSHHAGSGISVKASLLTNCNKMSLPSEASSALQEREEDHT